MTFTAGVSKHMIEGMLMGGNIPHLQQYLKKVLDEDNYGTSTNSIVTEVGMAVTRAK